MNTDWIAVQSCATISLAILTLILATIAIFQEKIHNCILRPKLELEMIQRPPDCHMTPIMEYSPGAPAASGWISENGFVGIERQIPGYYCRIRIHNKGGRVANNVEVFITELRRESESGVLEIVEEFIPTNLNWTHTKEMSYSSIAPDTYRNCDLLHIIKPDERKDPYLKSEDRAWNNKTSGKTILSFDTHVKPLNKCHLQPSGIYQLDLAISASNVTKPVRKTLKIFLSGKWFSNEKEMSKEGIAITLLE